MYLFLEAKQKKILENWITADYYISFDHKSKGFNNNEQSSINYFIDFN